MVCESTFFLLLLLPTIHPGRFLGLMPYHACPAHTGYSRAWHGRMRLRQKGALERG